MILTNVENGLRKEDNGVILAFEYGATLGVSILDQKRKELKTFQLTLPEINLLISYLKESKKMSRNISDLNK